MDEHIKIKANTPFKLLKTRQQKLQFIKEVRHCKTSILDYTTDEALSKITPAQYGALIGILIDEYEGAITAQDKNHLKQFDASLIEKTRNFVKWFEENY